MQNPSKPSIQAVQGGGVQRRAWLMWAIGLSAYIVAVLHRSSFGVAGLEATERFGLTATALASFVLLQLVVYTAAQLPVGLLLDRYGAKILIAAGAAVMAFGQIVLAAASTVPVAIGGRVLVGIGDAMTFVCVLRVAVAWFPARRAALIIQLTGLIGQLGQVISAVPLAAILVLYGWRAAFLTAGAVGLVVSVVVSCFLRAAPRVENDGVIGAPLGLRAVWRNPGVQLGFWTHFTTMFSNVAFVLLWGFPYLQAGQGRSLAYASTMITILVLTSAASSPLFGVLIGRRPDLRSYIAQGIVIATALSWSVVLLWPGSAPGWLLTLLVLVLAAGGPGSMIGFDLARSSTSPQRQGTAISLVNMGGFTATLFAILGIGVLLDLPFMDAPMLSPDRFAWAMAAQYPLWALGIFGIIANSRRARHAGADLR